MINLFDLGVVFIEEYFSKGLISGGKGQQNLFFSPDLNCYNQNTK